MLPSGRDAELMTRLLAERGMSSVTCTSDTALLEQLHPECGPIIVEEEALKVPGWQALALHLQQQPTWSNLPIIICESARRRLRGHALLGRLRNVTLLPRPLHIQSFIALVRSACDARHQQKHVQHLMENLTHVNHTLATRNQLLQKMTLELTTIEQKEREQIALRIHDSLSQLLALANIKIRMAQRMSVPAPLSTALDEIQALLQETLTLSRAMISDLFPRILQDKGLNVGLKSLGAQFAAYGLMVTVDLPGQPIHVVDARATLLYFTVRELLFNVVKHAEVQEASLTVSLNGSTHLLIKIEDHGKGFDPSTISEKTHTSSFGLWSIRERIDALGGTVRIDSQPGSGTCVTLIVPIKGEKRDENPPPDPRSTY